MKFPPIIPVCVCAGLPPCGGSGLKYRAFIKQIQKTLGLPPCGGSGLKCKWNCNYRFNNRSPSMRREWIEIISHKHMICIQLSPSMRREWIEIHIIKILVKENPSPSMRREWIEMLIVNANGAIANRLPPCGGSGLKYMQIMNHYRIMMSPSMRREWIEI